jgi:hypothetical protein
METKLLQHKMEFVKIKLGFDKMFVVDCKGRSGGLVLLWKSTIQVDIQNYSRRHISIPSPHTYSYYVLKL